MAIYEDLQWLEEELLEEEIEEEEFDDEEGEEEEDFLPRTRVRKQKARHAVYADERKIDDRDAVFVEKKKRKVKGIGRLKFLAFLETLAILAVLWWWIKWLY